LDCSSGQEATVQQWRPRALARPPPWETVTWGDQGLWHTGSHIDAKKMAGAWDAQGQAGHFRTVISRWRKCSWSALRKGGRTRPDPYFESNTVERVIQGQEEPEGCRADPCGREPPGGGQGTRPTEAKGHSRSNLELALERSQNEHSRKSTEGP
jgi:hypothetical protein